MYTYYDLRLLGDDAYAIIQKMQALQAVDIRVVNTLTESATIVGSSAIVYHKSDSDATYEIDVSLDEYQIVGYAYLNHTCPIYGYRRKMYHMHDSNLISMLMRMLSLLQEKRQSSDQMYDLHAPINKLRRMEAQIYANTEHSPD